MSRVVTIFRHLFTNGSIGKLVSMPSKRFVGMSPGGIIRTLREEQGLSQRELADRVGHIDAAGVSKIETGATNLGRARARRFARALGVDPSLLLQPSLVQPTNQDLADRLESLETSVDLLTGNQERLIAALESLAAPGQQAGEHD